MAGFGCRPRVYDDTWTVVGNLSLRAPGDVRALLRYSPFRPVVNVSYALDYAMWVMRPFGFHLTSVVLHMVTVALVFWVAAVATDDWRRRDGERAGSVSPTVVGCMTAALFAVHPIMTQAVGYVSGRSEVLCAVFFSLGLFSIRAALVRDRLAWALPSVAAVILAAGSKEVGVMLPFVSFAWDRLLLAPVVGPDRRRLRWLPVALMVPAVIVAIVRLAVFIGIEPLTSAPYSAYVMSQLRGVWRYVLTIVVPVNQSLVHAVEPRTGIDTPTVFSALALCASIVLAALGRRREPLVALGVAWFLLVLLPSSVVPLEEVVAEQRVYLASAGLFLAASAGAARLYASRAARSRAWRAVAIAVCVMVLASLVTLTIKRNATWADPVTLWQDAVRNAPASWRAHFGLGNALAEAGNCHDAIPELTRAAELSPRPQTFMNLATCFAADRRLDDAASAYGAALAIEPGYAPAHFNLALLALGAGDRATAQRHFLQAIPTDSRDDPWRALLLRTYMEVIHDPALTLEMCRRLSEVAASTPGLDECFRRARQ
jgi:hypothetical protein